jgi:2-(1,2-epoxy-1,2-dihydrophenyl)acetyl-CoA isomerase
MAVGIEETEAILAEGPVLLDLAGGVAHIRLNRPEAANALNVGLLSALAEAIMRCRADERVRCVLVSGEGPHFCAGGDVRDFASHGEALPAHLREVTAHLGAVAGGLVHLPVPVVAAVHGFAAGGGGFGLVCASDLVIAGAGSRFLLGATRVGMAPDAGSTVALAQLVGHRRAMEIALTNETLDAEAALAAGLVNRVVPDGEVLERGRELARELAAGPTRALGETKRLLWRGLGSSIDECLPEESRTVSELSGTVDSREGLAAVIERREPNFVGR